MDEIKIAIGVPSIGRFLPFVGLAAGLFARNDLAVQVVNQNDEEKIVEDILSQATPIGTPNAPSLLFSLLNGNDLVIIGGILNRPAFYLVGDSNLASVGDLRGKKVGINQPRRMAGMMMLALLRRWQLDSASDLQLVDLGVNDRSVEALRAGEVDAALLPPEKAFVAQAEGFRVVADSLDLDCHWVPLATTRRFLRAKPAQVAKVANIYRQSVEIFKNDSRNTREVIANQLPALRNHPGVLEKCYAVFAPLFEASLRPSIASLRSVLAEVARQDPRAKDIDAASIVENVI